MLLQDGLDAGARSLVPPALRRQLNQKTSAIPMFSLAELVEGTEEAPYFFTKADMVHFWMDKTGKKQEELPEHLILTDLRVLIVRMMQIPSDFKTIKIMPMASTVEVLKGVTASKEAAMAEAAKAAAAAPAAEVDAEAEPPPLVEVA